MNGRLYANLVKVRLGTWASEQKAAHVHDLAAIALCPPGAALNARPHTCSCCALKALLLFLNTALGCMMMRTGLQFDRAEYEADMVHLAEMTPEEVVAMLLRNSLGFSRCAQSCLYHSTLDLRCQRTLRPPGHTGLALQVHTGVSASTEHLR